MGRCPPFATPRRIFFGFVEPFADEERLNPHGPANTTGSAPVLEDGKPDPPGSVEEQMRKIILFALAITLFALAATNL